MARIIEKEYISVRHSRPYLTAALVVLVVTTLGCPGQRNQTFTLYVVNATNLTTASLKVHNFDLGVDEELLPQGGNAVNLYKLVLDYDTYTDNDQDSFLVSMVLSGTPSQDITAGGSIAPGEERAIYLAREETGFSGGSMGLIPFERKSLASYAGAERASSH